jgi:23S rRNA (adenine2503-C2)-methyltransferase
MPSDFVPRLQGFLPEEMAEFFSAEFSSLEPYRARQIFRGISRGIRSFDAMTDIPLSAREELSRRAVLRAAKSVKSVRADDGTVKLAFAFPPDASFVAHGEAVVETVILTDGAGRRTACLSSQAGCPLGCAFCKTGSIGFSRNLTAAEIVEQFFEAELLVPDSPADSPSDFPRIANVVFMGMGEPLLNLSEVRKAISILAHKDGRALSVRRITVSTAGIVDGILDLADNGPAARLAVSLPSCDDSLRAALMPGVKNSPLSVLKRAIAYWRQKTGRRCTIETALFSGVNTDARQMKKLAAFARDVGANINLIPWNPVDGLPFFPPGKDECRNALRALRECGANATVRTGRGGSVAGACGQLG